MHYSWKKLGRIFNPIDCLDRPIWMEEFAQAPCVLELEDCLRVYFSCRPSPDAKGQYSSFSAYIDLSKDHQFKILNISNEPVLKLGELGAFDEFGIYPFSVIRHESKIMAYYGGWTRCSSVPFNVAIGCASSYDEGKTFIKAGVGPILSYSPEEPFVISGPKIRYFNNKFYLFYIAGTEWKVYNNRPEPVYKIRLAVSNDGHKWEKLNRQLIPNIYGNLEAQASPDVFYYQSRYHMFFCYRHASDYRFNRERTYRIGHAESDDLLNWERNDSLGVILPSDEGEAFDCDMVAYPHIFTLNDQLYMMYLGNQVGRYGFGLAKLVERV